MNEWLKVRKRFTEELVIRLLREAESDLPVAGLCRRHGFSGANCSLWRDKFGSMSVSDGKRLKKLETENGRLKRRLADAPLENGVTKDESPRLLRRLQTLRRWSHEQEIKSFFNRCPRTRCSLGARA